MRLRTVIAKYNPLIRFEEVRRAAPYLVSGLRIMLVNSDPLVLRVEADLLSGNRVVIDLDRDDIRTILEAALEVDPEILEVKDDGACADGQEPEERLQSPASLRHGGPLEAARLVFF